MKVHLFAIISTPGGVFHESFTISGTFIDAIKRLGAILDTKYVHTHQVLKIELSQLN
jgi:hypothetical protein